MSAIGAGAGNGRHQQQVAVEHGVGDGTRQLQPILQRLGEPLAAGRKPLVDQGRQDRAVVVPPAGEGRRVRHGAFGRTDGHPVLADLVDRGEFHRHDPRAQRRERRYRLSQHCRYLGRSPREHVVLVDADPETGDRTAKTCKIMGHRRAEGSRVTPVMAGDCRQYHRRVADAAGHRTDMVERIRQRPHPGAAHPAPGRLHAGEPTGGRGQANRAAGIGAERAVAEPRRCRDARPGRRRAGPCAIEPRTFRGLHLRMVPGPGAFGHGKLAENNGTGTLQPVDHRRVCRRHMLTVDVSPGAGRGEGRVAQVLHRHRHAMQRSTPDAGCQLSFSPARARERVLRGYGRIALQPAIQLLDPLEQRARHLNRADEAGADQLGDGGETQVVQLFGTGEGMRCLGVHSAGFRIDVVADSQI